MGTLQAHSVPSHVSSPLSTHEQTGRTGLEKPCVWSHKLHLREYLSVPSTKTSHVFLSHIDHSIFSVHSYSMRKSLVSEVDGYNSDVVMIGNDDSDIVDDNSISGDGGGGSDG